MFPARSVVALRPARGLAADGQGGPPSFYRRNTSSSTPPPWAPGAPFQPPCASKATHCAWCRFTIRKTGAP
eukprot:9481411-Pyramimonas_sp.AAC.1